MVYKDERERRREQWEKEQWKKEHPFAPKHRKQLFVIACIIFIPIGILSMLDPKNWIYIIAMLLLGPFLSRK